MLSRVPLRETFIHKPRRPSETDDSPRFERVSSAPGSNLFRYWNRQPMRNGLPGLPSLQVLRLDFARLSSYPSRSEPQPAAPDRDFTPQEKGIGTGLL
jgi:hypothetical protein